MLRITTTNAQLAIETRKAQMNMNSTQPKLNINKVDTRLEMESELPKVLIDQYQCFAEAGLKNNMDILLEAKQLAMQKAAEYTAKIVADGNRLAAIESGDNPIPDFAERDAFPEKEFGYGTIPTSRPKIDVKGHLTIKPVHGKLEFNNEPGSLNVDVTPHEVNIYLKQKPSVEIEYLGEKVDTRI